jgi:long-subunit fatty acid transport protein
LGAYVISLESSVDPIARRPECGHEFRISSGASVLSTHKSPTAPIAAGLGVYAPFGFGLEYPTTSFSNIGKGTHQYVSINPVFALEITKTLSVAVGGSVNHGRVKLRASLRPATSFTSKAKALAGLYWAPLATSSMHSFGVTPSQRCATGLQWSFARAHPFV